VITRLVGALQATWLFLLRVIAVVVVLEIVATGALAIIEPSNQSDPRVAADAYRGVPWAADYFRELRAADSVAWTSYVYWRRRPFVGQFINVGSEGLRRTYRPPAPGASGRPLTVFVFGGSTVWGTGVRDNFTIPSALARQLAADGSSDVAVTNFGESGYVSTQEVIALEVELRRGARPDVVVFYDGVNDTFAALQSGTAGTPQNEANRIAEFNLLHEARRGDLIREAVMRTFTGSATVQLLTRALRRVTGTDASAATAPRVDARVADDVVGIYANNVKAVEGLGNEFGFHSLFYWQPVIFTKDRQTEYELNQTAAVAYTASSYDLVYDRIKKQPELASDPAFHDLSSIFHGEDRPFYIDFAHLSEAGNEVIAARIAADVRATRSSGPGR
jgi:lysophospholipase L1-like esterase